ncbi:hypothetical protein [Streptomyces sp. NPDC091278]|uniref:hypothetical protein n=1 Tax=Streptomyces sp. NPDC091278 TaxID=3155301 RepID=UPI00344B4D2F
MNIDASARVRVTRPSRGRTATERSYAVGRGPVTPWPGTTGGPEPHDPPGVASVCLDGDRPVRCSRVRNI